MVYVSDSTLNLFPYAFFDFQCLIYRLCGLRSTSKVVFWPILLPKYFMWACTNLVLQTQHLGEVCVREMGPHSPLRLSLFSFPLSFVYFVARSSHSRLLNVVDRFGVICLHNLIVSTHIRTMGKAVLKRAQNLKHHLMKSQALDSGASC